MYAFLAFAIHVIISSFVPWFLFIYAPKYVKQYIFHFFILNLDVRIDF